MSTLMIILSLKSPMFMSKDMMELLWPVVEVCRTLLEIFEVSVDMMKLFAKNCASSTDLVILS